MTVKNSALSETASANAKATISIYNNSPTASISTTTNSLASSYNQLFYYVGEPVKITDNSRDPEGAMETWEYQIKSGGTTVATSDNFAAGYKNNGYVSNFTGNKSAKTHTITFTKAGTYNIKVTVTDEMGLTATASRSIYVSPKPQPPTARISAPEYTFKSPQGATFSDASTDPNDDIVSWVWNKVEFFDAEVDPETDEVSPDGEWINITGNNTYYTGTLANITRSSNGSYSTAQGTLKFNLEGNFRVHLTVTDATGRTSTTID